MADVFTPRWIINTDSQELLWDDGQIGPVFRKTPWRPATEEEKNEWLLKTAKQGKISELKAKRDAFVEAGYSYSGHVFKTDNATIENATLVKENLSLSNPDRYKFFDVDKVVVDYENATNWVAFVEALVTEKDRIMFLKYRVFYDEIEAVSLEGKTLAEALSELEAIVINFS